MEAGFDFGSNLSSPWLDAQVHHEILSEYINELPAIFDHHSKKMRLRKQRSLKKDLADPSFSEEERDFARHEFHDAIRTYDHQLRQIVYSPAIIAVISCFEHYIRTAFNIIYRDGNFPGTTIARKKINNIDRLYPIDLQYIIEARNIISHVNGWLDFYDFGGKCKLSEHEFRQWASKAKFHIDDLNILVADEFSVNHCFNALGSFFAELPSIIKE